jgi:hypothetical protein
MSDDGSMGSLHGNNINGLGSLFPACAHALTKVQRKAQHASERGLQASIFAANVVGR